MTLFSLYTAGLVAVFAFLATIIAAAVILCAALPAVMRWRDGRDMEAIVEATREEHPGYADWDVRELTP